jgi:hypothetical protein
MTVDTIALDVTDALGPDFTYLQPTGEQRFDPATVAIGVGAAVVTWVATAILDGVKDAIKAETQSIVAPVVAAVTRRAREFLRRPFASTERSAAGLRQRLDEARDETDAARQALRALPAASLDSLPGAVAAAIRSSLTEQGVPAPAAGRVEVVVRAQVELLIEPGRAGSGPATRP